MQPVPVLSLREILTYDAQGKPTLEPSTKKDAQGQDVAITVARLNKYDEDTGQIKRTTAYEVDLVRLTNERDRLLAQAQAITDFLAAIPKP